MLSKSIIYYLAQYYIIKEQVIYNTWASNIILRDMLYAMLSDARGNVE